MTSAALSRADDAVPNLKRLLSYGVLIAILVIAVVLRLDGLGEHSLTQDESSIVEFTSGLIERGYPSRGLVEIKLITTYELLPYFMAPSVLLFGFSEFSLRLPALLFSLGTICIIFLLARDWFNTRTALWACLLFAVSPWAIYWGQNCFWPSQAQFFAVLCARFLYLLCHEDDIKPWYLYGAAISLLAMYLSWEGSGLFILVFAAMVVWLRWGRWNYLWNPHTWIAALVSMVVIVTQLTRRKLYQEPYLYIGPQGANDSGLSLTFNLPNFEPFLYLNIFSSQQNLVIAAFFFIGAFFVPRNWSLRFIYTVTIMLYTVYSLFLSVHSLRYVYIVLPYFLIAAAAGTFALIDWAFRHVDRTRWSIRIPALSGAGLILSLQVLTLAHNGINFRDGGDRFRNYDVREFEPGQARIDFKAVFASLRRQYRPDDVIITRSPFVLHLYSGLPGDYLPQRIMSSVVKYRVVQEMPYYSDKHMANPVLRSQREIDYVLNTNDRVWFAAVPLEATERHVLGEELFNHMERSMTLNTESHSVRLYLWEK